jgi:hypothetical protein
VLPDQYELILVGDDEDDRGRMLDANRAVRPVAAVA